MTIRVGTSSKQSTELFFAIDTCITPRLVKSSSEILKQILTPRRSQAMWSVTFFTYNKEPAASVVLDDGYFAFSTCHLHPHVGAWRLVI